LSLEYINGVLAAKNPEHLLPNAPAKGLLLYTIAYDSPMKEELHEQALFFG
jgi:hypothetical protein